MDVGFEETVEFFLFFKIDRGKTVSAAKNKICPPNRRDDLCLSLYTNKKLSHPSSLSCVLAVAPTMVRSAIEPKTTRLCGSIIVITL